MISSIKFQQRSLKVSTVYGLGLHAWCTNNYYSFYNLNIFWTKQQLITFIC